MQSETKVHTNQITSPAGHRVAVLRLEGDIASTSKDVVLGAYQALPKETSPLVLLDFTKVDYINSSGIALVIQMLIEASNSNQKVYAFGLSPHFTKVFTMVGITKYAGLFSSRPKRWRRCRGVLRLTRKMRFPRRRHASSIGSFCFSCQWLLRVGAGSGVAFPGGRGRQHRPE